MGKDDKNRWTRIDTYGGKFLENACQAISRDLLAHSMVSIDSEGFDIVMHVHDEAVSEIPIAGSDAALDKMSRLMEQRPDWASNLALVVDGYLTPFYRKD